MLKIDIIVNSIFNSNTYIISDTTSPDAWLIDCGDLEPILTGLEKRQLELKGIFITHTHFDHIYGLNKITKEYPKTIIYTSEVGVDALSDSKLNLSKYHEMPFVYEGCNEVVCKEGDNIKLFSEVDMQVIETPGHNPSCLSFYIPVLNVIFTGDSLIPGIKTVTYFPKSNKTLAKESEVKIMHLCNQFTMVHPGHNESIILNYLKG
jgi:hydroxyacylglutathione hydrolase